MPRHSDRAILAARARSGVEGRDPDASEDVGAVRDWHEAVYAVDADGRLDDMLRQRDLLGASTPVAWWREQGQ